LAERGSAPRGIRRWVAKGQRAKEADGQIKKWKGVCPSNIRGGIWDGSGIEEDAGAKLNGAVGKVGELMPKKPPAAGWVWKRCVIRVFTNKVAVVGAIGSTVGRGGGQERLGKVDLD
jgi:hypothetical protein